jgi:hypothetical protein
LLIGRFLQVDNDLGPGRSRLEDVVSYLLVEVFIPILIVKVLCVYTPFIFTIVLNFILTVLVVYLVFLY